MSERSIEEIDAIMQTIPEEWRLRWCGGENGPCACLGCVQIGNRLIMAKEVTGLEFKGDPEYISEGKIPKDIYNRLRITKSEGELWKERNERGRG